MRKDGDKGSRERTHLFALGIIGWALRSTEAKDGNSLSKGICYGINCCGITYLLSESGDGLDEKNVGVTQGARSVNNSAGTGIRGQ
jgi:hypothetical protein